MFFLLFLSACGGGGGSGGSSDNSVNGVWGTAELIEMENTAAAAFPQISFDKNGNAIAVWHQNDGSRFNIWANRFNGRSWGTAQLIENDNTGDAGFPQIAFDSNGNAIAVWEQNDGTRVNIWANRFDGRSWGTAELIETDNADNAFRPQIAFDNNSNAIAVWYQYDGVRSNIWANRFDGSSWGSAELIENDNSDNAFFPQIAFDNNGNAITVWHQYDGVSSYIWANRFDGSSWGSAELIETDNADNARHPQIAFDINGNAIAVWYRYNGSLFDIKASRFDGNSWSSAAIVDTEDAGDASFPQIAFDDSGIAMAVWHQYDGTRVNVWANRFDGNSWGRATLIETENTGDAAHPQIAFDNNGNTITVWHQYDGTTFNIWASRFDGSDWGTAELIENDNTGNAALPQIAFDDNSNALVVWHQYDGARFNILANRFE